MRNWLKQQVTEFTAWIGFLICLSVFFTPDSITFIFGIILIAIDDVKAAAWVKKVSPFAQSKIDQAMGDD